MELTRRLRNRMCLILLFILGMTAAHSGPNLDCTNDYEGQMFCQFEAQNCSEYNLTLQDNNQEMDCIVQKCGSGQCCYSFQMILVTGESHRVTVWKRGQSIESKIINITASVKPKAPTIISVTQSNGNFQVKWKTNTEGYLNNELTASVTYYKKGDTEKVSVPVRPSIVDGMNYYEIPGRELEPSTTYVVRVKSFTDWSGKFSDSSDEREFTTPASPHTIVIVIIFSLSIAATIFTCAAFGCYHIVKAKWLDTVARCPKPKLLDMHLGTEKILQPIEPNISSVSTDPRSEESLTDSGILEQSSEISPCHSSLRCADITPVDIKAGVQDALNKVFAHLRPLTSMTTSLLSESNKDSGLLSGPYSPCGDSNSCPGFTAFDNMTYSHNSSCLHQIMTDSSEVQTQAEIICDSGHHSIVTCPDQQVPLIPTDMSYQQCSANSAHAENSSLSSISTGINTIASCELVSRVEAGYKSFDEVASGVTTLNGSS